MIDDMRKVSTATAPRMKCSQSYFNLGNISLKKHIQRKVKVTNEANGKSVIVEVTDRGPFSKVREIDLTKKAFMEIASNKNSGVVIVKLEVMEPKK